MEEISCPHCGKRNHDWHRVYYESTTLLQELKGTMIGFCYKKGKYILVTQHELEQNRTQIKK